ncbi:SulP family inorganic anion transporter [Pontibacter pamirensis]|uniref:SulP family inorganic anion transporter n=1 Tax=Pontibacter pamirensis TaxID=2562824 RepID=UPI00138A5E7F|nr:SulP family inorganic anion transporter [Pontibacter pamirensis]
MKEHLKIFTYSPKINYKIEILAGLTVALALIPEAVAFSLIAGLPPLVGLYAAFVLGLVTALFGGRPGMISGATGAVAVVIVALAQTHGIEYVFATVVLAGVIQVVVGLLKLGKLIRLVPHPVMFGFVNGLAIIIFMSQLDLFKTTVNGETVWQTGTPLYILLGLVGLTIAIMVLLPRLTKAVPSSLVAILVVFAIVVGFNIDTKTVGDIASISGGFPPFHIPAVPFTLETLNIIFPYAAIMAGVGLNESLLTLNLVDQITETRGNGNRECLAQGGGNILSGLFFGMGGCAMLGQSLINVSSGARARLAGIVAAVTLLIFIMFAGPLIERIPMAALAGLMIMVAVGTFEWVSFKMIGKMPTTDVLIGILVAAVTVLLHNLALAVLIGVVLSALVFAWESARRIRARKYVDEHGVKHYELFGPLFFGSVTAFEEKFDVLNDPEEVIIDFKESRIADMSAIEAVNVLTERYHKQGKKLHLRNLSDSSQRKLINADAVIEVSILEPTFARATDKY